MCFGLRCMIFFTVCMHALSELPIQDIPVSGKRPHCLFFHLHLRLRGGSAAAVDDDYLRTRQMWLSGDASNPGSSPGTPAHKPSGSNPGTPSMNATLSSVASARVKQPAHATIKTPFQPFKPGAFRKGGGTFPPPRPSAGRDAQARQKPSWSAGGAGGGGGGRGGGARSQEACEVTLALLSKERFSVASSQHAQLKNISDTCRQLGGKYDPEHKRWTFPMHQAHPPLFLACSLLQHSLSSFRFALALRALSCPS